MPQRIDDSAFDTWARSRDMGAVYLFGSTARGTARSESDVDIGLWLLGKHDWERIEAIRGEAVEPLARALGLPPERLDVRILNDAPLAFQFRVIQPRRWLWENDHSTRIEFEVRTLQEYYDFQFFEDIYTNSMKRRLKEGSYGRRPTTH